MLCKYQHIKLHLISDVKCLCLKHDVGFNINDGRTNNEIDISVQKISIVIRNRYSNSYFPVHGTEIVLMFLWYHF